MKSVSCTQDAIVSRFQVNDRAIGKNFGNISRFNLNLLSNGNDYNNRLD